MARIKRNAESRKVSLAPLTLEQALSGAMKVDPKRVKDSKRPKRGSAKGL